MVDSRRGVDLDLNVNVNTTVSVDRVPDQG
jgi:hypothetical protein